MTPGEILDEIQKLPWEEKKVIQARLNNMLRGVRPVVVDRRQRYRFSCLEAKERV